MPPLILPVYFSIKPCCICNGVPIKPQSSLFVSTLQRRTQETETFL